MKKIILLHGAIGSKDQLEELAKAFKTKNFEPFLFNFSGHGGTEFNEKGFSISVFVEELQNFIEEKKLNGAHIFGYSMGGYVALYLASQKENLVGKIITLGTKFSWSKETAEKEIKLLDIKIINEKVPKFAEALKIRHGNNRDMLLNKTSEMMLELGRHNILNAENFSKIKNEVLLGVADKDNMVSAEETLFVYRHLTNASMYMLPDTKHPIETVDKQLFCKICIDFLEKSKTV